MSYSNKTHVILIKGEVRTTDVSLVKEDHECTGTCLVYYKRAQEKGKGRLYQYSLQEDKEKKNKDVIVLNKPTVLNPRIYEVYYKGKPQENVYILCHFKAEKFNYWTIGFTDGNMDTVCPDSDIKIHRKTSIIEPSKDIPEYLTQMAYLHGYDLRSSDGLVLLGDQYDHLRRGASAPLLEAYLDPTNFINPCSPLCPIPLYPFCTNASQMEAAKKALSNRISVIQGPPGTGKTETILNILLNLVLCGKSVLIVAGSNSAIDNITEKLQEEKLDFLISRLGREKNKESFVEHQKVEDLCPAKWDDQSLDIDASLSEIRQLSSELESLFIADRDLHEAIEQGKQATVLKLRRELEVSLYNEKRERLKSLSMAVLQKWLYKRFGGNYTRQSYTLEDLGEQSSRYEAFIQDYPIVLSTAFSATKCIAQNSLFDYVIMDEASQIDVATGALALSVAKNAVIVGDVKQLPNVIKEDMKIVSQALFNFFQIPKVYNYADHNFLQSICEVFKGAPETLLREHYRCHPKIVRFFNNEFYNGQLVAMTEDHGEKDVLVLRTTVPGYHAANFTNHREEEEMEYLKRDWGIDGKDAGVGIITPYNNQVKRIKDDEDIEEVIMVSTVHQFQGRQKDIIIISTVDNEYTRFVNDPNLFNVAVSRAKKQLILITNGNDNNTGTVQHLVDYIKESRGRCEKGKVKSLFDLIYPQYKKEYEEFVNAHPHIDPSEYDGQEAPSPTEIIAYGFITEVLKKFLDLTVKFRYPLRILISDTSRLEDEEEIKFAQNKDSHIDFMIFKKDMMEPFLAIEIDGSSYHIEDSFQAKRDSLKDGILAKYGIPIKRFRTKESVEEVQVLRDLLCIK